MSIQLFSFLMEAAILSSFLAISVGMDDRCPCSTESKLNLGCENQQTRNKHLEHYHDQRGLYGDCLPQVEENSMTCFKWSTKSCDNVESEEECKLTPRNTTINEVTQSDNGRRCTFKSPGFNRKRNYNRFFCIYNITLKCPGHTAELSAAEKTRRFEEDCGDYLAIYTDPSNRIPDKKICGDELPGFRMNLNSNSFLAILWTNTNNSYGRFEIEARCGDAILPTASTENSEEGSGTILINETAAQDI